MQAGCDVTSVPRKSLLRLLAEHCADPGERHALLHLCSSGGRAEYATQVCVKPETSNISMYPDGPNFLIFATPPPGALVVRVRAL